MTQLAEFLAAHGPMLLVGATALLSAGMLALLLQRAPIHRQRLAEMTVLSVLAWITLACVPLPRWALKTAAAPRDPAVSPVVATPADLPSDWQSVLASLIHPAESTPQRLADRVSPNVSTARAASSDQPRAATRLTLLESVRGWRVVAGGFLALAYVSGAVACAAWLVLGHVLLWRITRRARHPEPWLLDLFHGACKAVGVRQARVLVVSAPLRPVSCGLIRPTVLLGTDDCRPPNRPRLRQVLLHEAAHLRQRDAWGNALFNLAMPLLYFHPVYWVLRSRASLAREMVADDIAATSTSRAAYAADLLELARTRTGYRAAPMAAIGIFRSPSHFYRRMHMLMQRNIRLENRCSTAWKFVSGVACIGVLFAASATLGVRRAEAQESPKQVEIKQAKLDRSVIDAKIALDQAIARRDVMLKLAKQGAQPGEVFPDFRPRAAFDELDSRVALAQKNFDEVRAAQQSVRSAAGDDNDDAEKQERIAKERAEVEKAQADAQRQLAVRESVRQQLEARLKESDAALAQLRAQLAQAEAQLKIATAQAQQEMDHARAMLKDQMNKAGGEWNAEAGQFAVKIDQIIRGKLKKDGIDAMRGSDLEELVRRTYLDVAGRLPTPDERIATQEMLKNYLQKMPREGKESSHAPAEKGRPEAGQLNTAVSALRPQLDLVALANSYADATGAIAAAQEEVNGADRDPHERAAAKAKLVGAEQKARLLRSITQAALQQAKQEYDLSRKRAESGVAPMNEAMEAEGRVRILSLILQSSGDGKSSDLQRQ